MEGVAFSAAVTGVMSCSLPQSQVQKAYVYPKLAASGTTDRSRCPGCGVIRKHGFRSYRKLRGHTCRDEQASCSALHREMYPSNMQIGAWAVSSLVSIFFHLGVEHGCSKVRLHLSTV